MVHIGSDLPFTTSLDDSAGGHVPCSSDPNSEPHGLAVAIYGTGEVSRTERMVDWAKERSRSSMLVFVDRSAAKHAAGCDEAIPSAM